MNILVTGSSGFFGSWLVPGLEAAGYSIVPFDIQVGGNDILNTELLARTLTNTQCEAVLHLAAYPHYKRSVPPQEFTRVNIIGTMSVLKAMKQANVKTLVYISSGAVYGFGPYRSLDGWVKPPISEATKPENWAMIDVYAGSKLAAEAAFGLMDWDWSITSLRINCIEPHNEGAEARGDHWGWWCSQALAIKAVDAALRRRLGGLALVNVAEPNPNMDLTQLDKLLTIAP